MAWPDPQQNRQYWQGDFQVICELFVELATTISQFEPVHIIGEARALALAKSRFGISNQLTFETIPTNDFWIRDTGPTFLVPLNSKDSFVARAIAPQWNAWGGKYSPWEKDAQIASAIGTSLNLPVTELPIVLEGGAFDSDGEGTLLISQSSVVDPKRNKGWSRSQIESLILDTFTAEKVVWLNGSLLGDDTDGHIDQLVRFIKPGVVAVATQPNREDPNHATLATLWQQLMGQTDAKNRKLELVPIRIPSCYGLPQQQLPASYLNFYIANGLVTVPLFNVPEDGAALTTIQELFPDRQVIGFDCSDLVKASGCLHCITRHQPLAP
jgi:agmatine deiminase